MFSWDVANARQPRQVMAVPDFRNVYPPKHRYRKALRGLEYAFSSWERLRAHRLNAEFTVAEAMATYRKPTSHSKNFEHFHDWTACHALSVAAQAVIVSKEDGVIKPRFSEPDGKRAFRALFDGLIAPILPFVWEVRRRLVPARYWPWHPQQAEVYNSGFTYVGLNVFMDGHYADAAPGFAAWYMGMPLPPPSTSLPSPSHLPPTSLSSPSTSLCACRYDSETMEANGLHYHGDRGNTRFKFGAVVVMGSFQHFHQHYPAFGCTMFTPGWCMLVGDYSDLWHAVGPGSGYRVSITLFDHEVCTFGVRSQDGYVIDWSKLVDNRKGDERYLPDIEALVSYAYEYSRHCHKNGAPASVGEVSDEGRLARGGGASNE